MSAMTPSSPLDPSSCRRDGALGGARDSSAPIPIPGAKAAFRARCASAAVGQSPQFFAALTAGRRRRAVCAAAVPGVKLRGVGAPPTRLSQAGSDSRIGGRRASFPCETCCSGGTTHARAAQFLPVATGNQKNRWRCIRRSSNSATCARASRRRGRACSGRGRRRRPSHRPNHRRRRRRRR